MFKNVAQKVTLFAFDYSTGAPKTGDAANLTFYVSKDDGTVTALTDTSATELSPTNAPGWYTCDLTQAETNADKLLFTGKSSTGNVAVVGALVYTTPANFSTLSVDGSGRVDIGYSLGQAITNEDGTAQAGGASSITLASGSSSANGTYNGRPIALVGGTGSGQSAVITDYVGSTKVATVTPAWVTQPDDTSKYVLGDAVPDVPTVAEVADAVWDEAQSGHTSTGTFGSYLDAQVSEIASGTGGGGTAPTAAEVATAVWASGTRTLTAFGFTVTANPVTVSGTVGTLDALNTALNTAHGAGSWATATGFSTLDAAGVRTAVGLTSANLNTQLVTIAGYIDTEVGSILAAVDTEVGAIKAKTDQLTFTTTGRVDATTLNNVTLADGSVTGAKFTMPDESPGKVDYTNALALWRRVGEWHENERNRDQDTGELRLMNAAGTDPLATQTQSTSGSTDTQTGSS